MNILIIDDEYIAQTKMLTLLGPYGQCSLAGDAAQALKMCIEAIKSGDAFELISIDIQLGDDNGNELLEKIIQLETKTQQTPAKKIMVTAMGTAENLVLAHSKGCDAFLVKPVKRNALDEKMASMGFTKKENT
jgi:CheY-like chemotaxis protein